MCFGERLQTDEEKAAREERRKDLAAVLARMHRVLESRVQEVRGPTASRTPLVRVCTHHASRVHELVPARWKELFGPAAAR